MKYLFFLIIFISTLSFAQNASVTRGYIDGHEFVDLGLSVKWATCNVGATYPYQAGNYFAWGEIRLKSTFTQTNCSTSDLTISNISGNPEYDVATVKWGSQCRIPKEKEVTELLNKCDWIWTTQSGIKGYLVTGPNGNSIFLPVTGSYDGAKLFHEIRVGYYWSASASGSGDSSVIFLCEGDFSCSYNDRYRGLVVRPVSNGKFVP